MRTYEKIETIYKRDTQGTKKLIPGEYRNDTIKMLKDIPWAFTEKINGTNIRVCWDGHNVSFGGRTDAADIPKHLLEKLEEMFGGEENEQLFEQMFGEKEVIFYGEGYGPKINNGGSYRKDVSFILFDIYIGCYLERDSVEEIAKAFNVDVVPVIFTGTLDEGVAFASQKKDSTIGTAQMEGLVGRPVKELQDRLGRRIIVKLKYKDLAS